MSTGTQLSDEEMAGVVRRIALTMSKLNGFWGMRDEVCLHPGASSKQIDALASSVKHPLPPSYKQLLRLFNGIDDIYGLRGKLLPTDFRKTVPDFDLSWRRPTYLVFIADEDWNAVAFDALKRKSDGEMEVIEIAENIDADRWSSLSAFLIGYLQRLEGWLATEQADRALRDDE
jgi:hypothetical protein